MHDIYDMYYPNESFYLEKNYADDLECENERIHWQLADLGIEASDAGTPDMGPLDVGPSKINPWTDSSSRGWRVWLDA